ncbi:MAG: type II secretion system protein [Elusimicrobia bacterium]|nr:type II secretion system protein [Elusimicrobiota bacterium]
MNKKNPKSQKNKTIALFKHERATRNRSPSGVTLIEMLLGLAMVAIITLVITGIFRAGIVSYRYALGQTLALSSIRQAIEGQAGKNGFLPYAWEARLAASLPSSNFSLISPTGFTVEIFASGGYLFVSDETGRRSQAEGIGALNLTCYGLDDVEGLIESDNADDCALITTRLTTENLGGKVYDAATGAALRNHP